MKDTIMAIGVILLPICLIIGIAYGDHQWHYGNPQTIECTINEKWVKRPSNNSSEKYLVSCDDKVYEITDLMLIGKLNSADIYANLHIGKRYEIQTTGYRSGYLSTYQNINAYKEIEE